MNDPTIRYMTWKEASERACPLAPRTNLPCIGPHCMGWRMNGVVRRNSRMPPSPIDANVVMVGPPEGVAWPGEWEYDADAGTQVYVETLISAESRLHGYCGMVPPRFVLTQSDQE